MKNYEITIKTNKFEDFMDDVRDEIKIESDSTFFKQSDTNCTFRYNEITPEQKSKLEMILSRYK